MAFALIAAWGTASAQQLFADDFETGDVSRWDNAFAAQPGSTRQIVPIAAHRGSFGQRYTDGQTAISDTDGALTDTFSLDAGVHDIHTRQWHRFLNASGAGLGGSVTIQRPTGPSTSLTEVYHSASSVRLQWWDRNASGNFAPAGLTPDAGTWFLMELSALGVGTADGGARLYINGVLRASAAGIDWTSVVPDHVMFGEHYTLEPFVATFDLDDPRASTTPLASRLGFALPSSAAAGACVPLSVTFAASSGEPAPAPYDLDVSLSLDGGAATLLAADCSTPVSTVHFAAGATDAGVWLLAPDASTLLLQAGHQDFLPGAASLSIGNPVIGPTAPPGGFGVGCDCSSAGPHLAVAGLLLAVAGVHRRRKRPVSDR